jgi:hypothetical protein
VPTLTDDYQVAPTMCSAQVAAGCNGESLRLVAPSVEIDVRSIASPVLKGWLDVVA